MPTRNPLRPWVGALVTAVIATAACPRAAAQMAGDPGPHREAMRRLGALLGDWEGDGWVASPAGRQAIRQYESVRYASGGTVLVIEGTARAKYGDAIGEVVFDAFAVVSWSADGGFRVRSYLGNGLYADRPIAVGDDGFTWEQQTPSGPIRYRLDWSGGEWHEAGRMVRADGAEVPTMEFTMHRVTPAP